MVIFFMFNYLSIDNFKQNDDLITITSTFNWIVYSVLSFYHLLLIINLFNIPIHIIYYSCYLYNCVLFINYKYSEFK